MTRTNAMQIGLVLVLAATAFTLANPRWARSVATRTIPMHATTDATAPIDTPDAVAMTTPATQSMAARAPRLVVAFKLDPNLTRGLYLGDRWVSPPSFLFAQAGRQYVVKAKLQSIDSQGEHSDLIGDWAATNPQMVAIERRPGDVTIVVRQPGESDLKITAGGDSKVLHVRARQLADAMEVAIDQ